MSEADNQFSFFDKYLSGEAHNTFWNFVARGVGFLNTAITIYALTIYQYGVFQLLLASYAFFSYFISWGGFAAGTEIVRLSGEGREDKAKRLFWEFNLFRLGNAVLLWAAFFWGANLPFMTSRYGPDAIILIKILSFLFLSEAFLGAVQTILTLRLKFEYLASRSATGKIFQLGILLYFYFYSNVGLMAVMLSVVASHFLSALASFPQAFKLLMEWKHVEMSAWGIFPKLARAHGKWASLRGFVGQLSSRLEPWFIKFFLGTDAVGIYSVASQMAGMLRGIVPVSTLSTLIPRIASEEERAKRIFVRGVKYLIIANTIVMAAGITAAPIAVLLFFTQYAASLPYFLALVIIMPLRIGTISDILLSAYRDQKYFFLRTMTRNFASILFMLILLPVLGLWGLVINDIFFNLAVTWASYSRLVSIRPEFRIKWGDTFTWDEEDTLLLKKAFAGARKIITFS